MNKRSLWHLTFIMSAFILLNTFVFDKGPIKEKSAESIVDVELEHLPVTQLKTTLGHAVCSTITLGDVYVTLSTDNLPKTLIKDESKVHLIKKSDEGILIYSNKISPTIESVPYLKEGDDFIILTQLSSGEPKVFAATFTKDGAEFIHEKPDSNGIAVVETKDGLAFSGLWSSQTNTLTDAVNIEELKELMAVRNLTYRSTEEKFYCLENDYMQVVFSDKGGAIAEINLKLRSEEDPDSIILPLSIDRKLNEESPQNNRFPLHRAYYVDEAGHTAFMPVSNGGYTPLLRRDIVDDTGRTLFKVPAEHYALALKNNDDPRISSFSVTRFSSNTIQFKGNIEGREVTRSYKLVNDAPYTIEMRNSANGFIRELELSSGILEAEVDSGSASNSLLYYNYDGKKMKVKTFKLPKTELTTTDISPSWTANTNGFFGAILHPKGSNPSQITSVKIDGKDAPSRVTLVDIDKGLYPKERFPGYELLTPYNSSVIPEPYYFYAGPLEKNTLNKVDAALASSQTGANPEFIKAITVRGWLTLISDPFARFMNIIIDFFYTITGSWGVSIILLTITLHLMLYPFSLKGHKAMLKMKKIGPKIKALEAKYKSDPQRLRTEQMMLYRNEGVNPLATFLPLLLPLPFFIGMFDLLKTKFSLRGATFIPGWIDSLTAPDVVFSWGVNIPFIGNEFHLLPILGAALMFISQKYASSAQNTNKNPTDMEKQMKSMMPILMIMVLFFFYNLASGLSIYLIMSSALRTVQQWYLNKKYSSPKGGTKVLKS